MDVQITRYKLSQEHDILGVCEKRAKQRENGKSTWTKIL